MKSQTLVRLFLVALVFSQAERADADVTLKERLLQKRQVGAHRGGNLSGRGNTMLQFKRALADGADIIETDLQLSKDGVVMVFHDKTLSDLTNCRGKVSEHILAELRLCRFKTNAELIPTFEELLKWSVGRVVVNAELKKDEATRPAIDLMNKFNGREWVYFQTQGDRKLYQLARACDAKANLLFAPTNWSDAEWAITLPDPRLIIIEFYKTLHDARWIAAAKRSGRLTSANSFQISQDKEKSGAASCDRLIALDFDILITDQTADCVRQRNQLH